MVNENELLSGLKEQKCNYLEKIIRIYTPYVSAVVYNTAGTSLLTQDIEEVVSDTFFALWMNAEKVDIQKGGIRSYIGAIARNKSLNKLRNMQYCEELCEDTATVSDDPEIIFIKNEEKTDLIRLIMSLGEPDSEIFLRYYYYNEKIRVIANAMHINPSTVKSKLKRGKEHLKKLITEKGAIIYEQKQN